MDSGHTDNVFPDKATLKGTIRSYDETTKQKMMDRIHKLSEDIASAFECTAKVNIWDKYPAVINHSEQT